IFVPGEPRHSTRPGPLGPGLVRENLSADLAAREAGHLDASCLSNLRYLALISVESVHLFGEHDLLEERVQATFNDLRESSLRLALVLRDLGDDVALLVDVCRGDILTAEVERFSERDVLS